MVAVDDNVDVRSAPTKSSQKAVSAVHTQRSDADSPLTQPLRDDHKRLAVARALFAFTTKNPRYASYMVRMFCVVGNVNATDR